MVTLLRSDPSHDGASINKDNNPSAPPSEHQTNAESSVSPLCRPGGRMEAEPCYFPALCQHSRIAGFSFFSLRKTKAPTTDNKYIKLMSKGLCSAACCKLQQTSTCLSLVDMRAMWFPTLPMAWWEFPGSSKNTGYHLRKIVKTQAFPALFLTPSISSAAQENMSYRL